MGGGGRTDPREDVEKVNKPIWLPGVRPLQSPQRKGVLPGINPWRSGYRMEYPMDEAVANDMAYKIDVVLEGRQLAHEKQYLERLAREHPGFGGSFAEANASYLWNQEALDKNSPAVFQRGLSDQEKADLVELLRSPGAWNTGNTPGGDHHLGDPPRWKVELAVANVTPKGNAGEISSQVGEVSKNDKSIANGRELGTGMTAPIVIGGSRTTTEGNGRETANLTTRTAPATAMEGNVVVRLTDGITKVEMVMPHRIEFKGI